MQQLLELRSKFREIGYCDELVEHAFREIHDADPESIPLTEEWEDSDYDGSLSVFILQEIEHDLK